MKTSKRFLLGTLLLILVSPVTLIAWNRATGPDISQVPALERTPQDELALLRDFTMIKSTGDYSLEVFASTDYSVDYSPLPDNRGSFTARIQEGALVLNGFGNISEDTVALVRVGMPQAGIVDASYSRGVVVRGFDSGVLALSLSNVRVATLQDNAPDALDVSSSNVREINLVRTVPGSSRIRTFGGGTVVNTSD